MNSLSALIRINPRGFYFCSPDSVFMPDFKQRVVPDCLHLGSDTKAGLPGRVAERDGVRATYCPLLVENGEEESANRGVSLN